MKISVVNEHHVQAVNFLFHNLHLSTQPVPQPLYPYGSHLADDDSSVVNLLAPDSRIDIFKWKAVKVSPSHH